MQSFFKLVKKIINFRVTAAFLVAFFVITQPLAAAWQDPTSAPPADNPPGFIYNIANPATDPAQPANVKLTGQIRGDEVAGRIIKASESICLGTTPEVCLGAWDIASEIWQTVNGVGIYYDQGKVGIGIQPDSDPAHSYALWVDNDNYDEGVVAVGKTRGLKGVATNDGGIGIYASAVETDSIAIFAYGANYGLYSGNGLNYFAGNVGIGDNATFPTQKLLVSSNSGDNRIAIFSNANSSKAELNLGAKNSVGDIKATNLGNEAGRFYLWTTDGGEVVTVSQDGKVGIGTTAPAGKLDIVASDPKIRQEVQRSSGGAAFAIADLYAKNLTSGLSAKWGEIGVYGSVNTSPALPSVAYLYMGAGDTVSYSDNTFRLYPNKIANFQGNVGIGTTAPGQKLHVLGSANSGQGIIVENTYGNTNGNAIIDVRVSGGNSGRFVAYSPAFAQALWANRVAVFAGTASNGLNLAATAAAGDIAFITGGSAVSNERMRITSAGDVGIGVTNPGVKLEVNGNIKAIGVSNFDSEGDVGGVFLGDTQNYIKGAWGIGVQIGAYLANDALTVRNETGNVGIGTESPGAKLEVAGQVKITGGTPAAGEVLTSDASGLATWELPATTLPPSGPAGGDLSGTYPNPTVAKIQGNQVSATPAPIRNQVLKWTGSSWTPMQDADTWQPNTGSQEGYVTMPGVLDPNKVWLNDAIYGPGWYNVVPGSLSLNYGQIYVGDAFNQAATVTMNGDATINSAGTLTIANNAVTSPKILDGTIATADLGDNIVTSAKIADGTIVNADIANNAVTSNKIQDSTIITVDLSDNAVTSAKIQDGTIATADLGVWSVTGDKINAMGALDNYYMKYTILGGWAPAALTSLPPSGPAGGDLAGTYPNPTIAANAVTSAKILDGTIATADLGDNIVTSAKITDSTIANVDIANNAVNSNKIQDLTIIAGDLADGAVTSAKIFDGTIVTADLANSAVTSAKIFDGTIAGIDISPMGAGDNYYMKYTILGGWGPAVLTSLPPSGNAGGDLTGTYPNPTIANDVVTSAKIANNTIAGIDISPMGALDNYYMKYTILGGWAPAALTSLPPSGNAGGDLSGTYPNPVVDGLQNKPVSATAPTANQVLKWNGTAWAPSNEAAEVDPTWNGANEPTGFIYRSGQVSIGNTVAPPAYTNLEVYGTDNDNRIRVVTDYNNGQAELNLISRNSPSGTWVETNLSNTGGNFRIWSSAYNGDVFNILGNGNVGIGATNPGAKLDVAGNINMSGNTSRTMFFGNTGVAVPGAASVGEKIQLYGGAGVGVSDYALGVEVANMWFNTDDGYKWYIDSVAKVAINGSGNLGIGTITPGAKLEVNGTVKITDGSQGANKVLTSDAGGLASWKTIDATMYTEIDPTWNGVNTASGDIYRSGSVGIGTAGAPTVKLEVNGNIKAIGTSNFDAAGDAGGVFLGDTANYIKAVNGTGVQIGAYLAEDALTVRNETGNVGIGTESPSNKLDVRRNDDNDGDAITFGSKTYYMGRLGEDVTTNKVYLANTYFGDSSYIDFRLQGTDPAKSKMIIKATGEVGIGTTVPVSGTKLDVNGLVNIGNPNGDRYILTAGSNNSVSPGINSVKVYNTYASGLAEFVASNDNNNNLVRLGVIGASAAANGALRPDAAYIDANDNLSGGLSIIARHATGGDIRFYAGGHLEAFQRMIINKDGDVGIGTATPGKELDVVGDIRASGAICANGGTNCLDAASVSKWIEKTPAAGDTYGDIYRYASQGNGGIVVGDSTARARITAVNMNQLFAGYSGTAGSFATLLLGRVPGDNDLNLAVAGGNGQFFTGTVAGDVALRADKTAAKLFLGVGAGNPMLKLSFLNGNTAYPRADFAKDVYLPATGELRAGFLHADAASGISHIADKLGIGTASPGHKLEVDNGNILVQGTGSFDQATENAVVYLGDTANYIEAVNGTGIQIGAFGASDAVTIKQTTGYVGIGTTAPGTQLHVNTTDATAAKFQSTGVASQIMIRSNYATADQKTKFIRSELGGLDFGRYNDAETSSAVQMFISNAGDVGINTVSPGAKLDVNGSAVIGHAASDYLQVGNNAFAQTANSLNPGVYVYKSGTTAYGMKLQYTGTEFGTMIFGPNQQDRFIGFGKVGANLEDDDMTEYMRIDLDNGNVGIGTATPSKKLDVVGDILASGTICSTAGGTYCLNAATVLPSGTSGQTLRHNGTGWVANSVFQNDGSKVTIDPNLNTQALQILGTAETTEKADMFVDASGALVITTINGNDTAQYIDLRPEDDQYGLILRNMTGLSTSQFANFSVVDATDDYLAINLNSVVDGDALVVAASNNVGIGTATPGNKLQVVGSGGTNVDFYVNGRMRSANDNGGMWVGTDNTRFIGGTGADKGIGIFVNSAWRLTAKSDGSVSTSGNLDVGATLSVPNYIVMNGQDSIKNLNDEYLRLNQTGDYANGVHTPGLFSAGKIGIGVWDPASVGPNGIKVAGEANVGSLKMPLVDVKISACSRYDNASGFDSLQCTILYGGSESSTYYWISNYAAGTGAYFTSTESSSNCGYVDIYCPAGYRAISGGGWCQKGASLRESRSNYDENTRSWRISCDSSDLAVYECNKYGGGTVTCLKISNN